MKAQKSIEMVTAIKQAKNIALALTFSVLYSSQAHTLPFVGTDITIHDGENYSSGKGSVNEDNETESGMVKSQEWDLEGFWLQDDNNLAIVGGFDFKNGVEAYNGGAGEHDFRAGDIFIDVDGLGILAGDTTGISGQDEVNSTFGYEFVIDINWESSDNSYVIRQLTDGTYTRRAFYGENYGSNPWLYTGQEEGESGLVVAKGNFSYQASASNDGVDWVYDGWTGTAGAGFHNAAYNFDLSEIFAKGFTDLTFHNTMGCGNDNLMGKASISVPEPSSIALLGLGILGLSVLRKRAA